MEEIKGDIDGCTESDAHRFIETLDDDVFSDFWEHDLTKFTSHFLWCCYAIVWGIRKYDIYNKEKKDA